MSQSQAVLETRLAPLVAGTASESGANPSSFAKATDPPMPSTCDQYPSHALYGHYVQMQATMRAISDTAEPLGIDLIDTSAIKYGQLAVLGLIHHQFDHAMDHLRHNKQWRREVRGNRFDEASGAL